MPLDFRLNLSVKNIFSFGNTRNPFGFATRATRWYNKLKCRSILKLLVFPQEIFYSIPTPSYRPALLPKPMVVSPIFQWIHSTIYF
jgi:hypothetical protein